MFDTARMLMRASLASRLSPQDDEAMRMAVLERTYGNELSPETYRAVEARLRRRGPPATIRSCQQPDRT